LGQVAVEQHGVAAGHEKSGYEASVTLYRHGSVQVVQVLLLDVSFLRFDPRTQVMQSNCFSVDLYPASEYQTMNLIAFVSNQRKRHIGPALHRRGLVLPSCAPDFEDVVIHIQGKGYVEIVRTNGWVWALCFCGFEIQEADLVPEERPHVTLERCEGVR
jgi:hypothetical protein